MSGDASRNSYPHSRVALGALVVAGAVLVILPDLLRLDTYLPFAQLVAFRPQLVPVALALAVLVALRRDWRPAAAGLAVVALVGGALLVPRAVAGGAAAGPAPGGTLTVLALNVKNGSADLDSVAGMIRRLHPDLVSLPEYGPRYAASCGGRWVAAGTWCARPLTGRWPMRMRSPSRWRRGCAGRVSATSASSPARGESSRPWR